MFKKDRGDRYGGADNHYQLEKALVRKDWDAVVSTNECLHCKGTGKCDDDNECGFCEASSDDDIQTK